MSFEQVLEIKLLPSVECGSSGVVQGILFLCTTQQYGSLNYLFIYLFIY